MKVTKNKSKKEVKHFGKAKKVNIWLLFLGILLLSMGIGRMLFFNRFYIGLLIGVVIGLVVVLWLKRRYR